MATEPVESEQDADTFVSDLLPDISDLPLDELRAAEGTVLAHALERLANDMRSPDSAIAGFTSSL